MFKDKSLMTVADAAGVVGEAPVGHVRLNGVLYKLPEGYPASVAQSICMIEVDTKGCDSVHIPQFRLEADMGMKPKVFTAFKDITLKAGWNSSGEAALEVNPFSLSDSKATLTLRNSDVVTSGKEKLSAFKKPATAVGSFARGVAKTQAKAKVGGVCGVAKGKGKGKGRGKR